MARGFESKSVADQQESLLAARRPPAEEADPLARARRRRLELALEDVRSKMRTATAEPHREVLGRALKALEKELASLP